MKKILSLLMSLTVTSSAAMTAISCSTSPPTNKIETKFAGNLKEGTLDDEQLYVAYNGSDKTPYGALAAKIKDPQLLPLNGLTVRMINLLGFNASMVTNAKKIDKWRELYIGNDENTENLRNAPSVDGIFFGEKVEGKNLQDFYKNYKNTHINSLAGLYQLYSFAQENGFFDNLNGDNYNALISKDNENQIGAGAQESLGAIHKTFTENKRATEGFFDSFLNLTNQSLNSSWISQTLTSKVEKTKLDSDILSFNEKEDGEGKNKKTTIQLDPDGDKKDLGKVKKYKEINTKVEAETKGEIGDDPQAPFDLLMLPTDKSVKTDGQVAFDKNWEYPEQDKEQVDGDKTWDIRQPDDSEGWKIRATDKPTGEDDKQIGFIKTNESMIVPIQPLTIEYVYTTNVRNSEVLRYKVEVTFENIQAVFRPRIASAKPKDEDKDKVGNKYVKWQLTHYQFTNNNDPTTAPGKKQLGKPQKGYYSGMKISKLSIKEL